MCSLTFKKNHLFYQHLKNSLWEWELGGDGVLGQLGRCGHSRKEVGESVCILKIPVAGFTEKLDLDMFCEEFHIC